MGVRKLGEMVGGGEKEVKRDVGRGREGSKKAVVAGYCTHILFIGVGWDNKDIRGQM